MGSGEHRTQALKEGAREDSRKGVWLGRQDGCRRERWKLLRIPVKKRVNGVSKTVRVARVRMPLPKSPSELLCKSRDMRRSVLPRAFRKPVLSDTPQLER